MFERLLNEDPAVLEMLTMGLNDSGYTNFSNQVYYPLALATANYLTENPDIIDMWLNRSETGRASDFQRLIDYVYHGAGDDALQGMIDVYAASTMRDITDPNDPRWEDWAYRMGELQARVNDAGGNASFDAGNVAWLIVTEGVGLLPAGGAVNKGITTVRTVVGSYQSDTTYANLGAENQQDLDDYVLAMTAIASSDPDAAAQLGELLDGTSEGTRAIFDFQDSDGGNNELHLRITRLARQIETSRTTAGIQ